MEIKICGNKLNIAEVAALHPDYLGFIFYDKSLRYFTNDNLPQLQGIKKVGVFVNEHLQEIANKIKQYDLAVVQLHGKELPSYCQEIKQSLPHIEIWKAFSVDESFDFNLLKEYDTADKFLFDTKGENYGGNGIKFDWRVLEKYTLNKPFILSGGIDEHDAEAIKMLHFKMPLLSVLDINSRFETAPGEKEIKKIRRFMTAIKNS